MNRRGNRERIMKWRGNGERMMKWWGNGERFTLYISSFSLNLLPLCSFPISKFVRFWRKMLNTTLLLRMSEENLTGNNSGSSLTRATCYFRYRKWIERREIKRKWGNVESESFSISSFSLHFLFISSFSLHFLAARLQGCNDSCSPV